MHLTSGGSIVFNAQLFFIVIQDNEEANSCAAAQRGVM
jgi:hypothetical protein